MPCFYHVSYRRTRVIVNHLFVKCITSPRVDFRIGIKIQVPSGNDMFPIVFEEGVYRGYNTIIRIYTVPEDNPPVSAIFAFRIYSEEPVIQKTQGI